MRCLRKLVAAAGVLVSLAVATTLEAAAATGGAPLSSTEADPPPPESSQILRVFEVPANNAGKEIDLSGYQRPDVIGYIYDGDFGLVPGAGLDNLRYYVQAVSDLTKQCPGLKLEDHKDELIPYLLSGAADLVRRFREGKLSPSELAQAGWMAMLSANENAACQYNPNGPETLAEAQERCDAAGAQQTELGVMPSISADADIKLFLQRHSCDSAETKRLADNLIAFGREAPAQSMFSNQMPSPTSSAGIAYTKVFENCSRSSIDPVRRQWCECYVHTLSGLSPNMTVLNGLANNPFVDGRTFMTWVALNVKGGEDLYKCTDAVGDPYHYSEAYAPRPTACLVGKSQSVCDYRAAWGEFSITAQVCKPEITSKSWGWREVDCGAGGTAVAVSAAPRQWKRGSFTMIDYEQDVPASFVPELPADATARWPIDVRFLARSAPGQLKEMTLGKVSSMDLQLPMDLEFDDTTGRTFAALFKQNSFTLACDYVSDGHDVHQDIYWYREVPKDVADAKIPASLAPYFGEIKAPRTTCPAQQP